METNHLHAAVRRVAARHTLPKFYLSDNAPQFKLLRTHFESNAVEPLEWKMIATNSPWEGGVYERLLRIFKTSLERTLRDQPYCGPVQFRTVVAEIAGMMNSRPLISPDSEPGGTTITPNDLIKVTYTPINLQRKDLPISNTDAANKLTSINNEIREKLTQFWSVWKSAYLESLRQRSAVTKFQSSPQKVRHNPKIGEVVIINDEKCKRAA